ncbi:MAG: Phosphopantothenoylcysteine decarboxylase / Phosphopantothenoylcysteine synthetase [uncultured Solirubrobacteraceae bacterium]|uniref:Coenzyme A biosynthesis bifunctional protein CoaBC n=1 Tax=uncultured Solirubrobacteraceae bacterium TaxID=1162706 RepID=A0A6J4T0B5_9ACTN|nr:MAG: Phosphopantothenoylcysteine decarboxylase / Phosphopantothenoylcysteine synthetase [uncultured Solirubrobacteraceae bacterium]
MARILLGVTGGIAAYKALELARLAIKAGHSVRVIQTEAATRFVGPQSFAGITGAPVLVTEWEPDPLRGAFPGDEPAGHAPLSHLALVESADVLLIAPASANTVAKLAAGSADNLLTAAALACRKPLLVAPAMNDAMYENAATRENVARLRERGITVLDPGTGALGSLGEWGVGRLPEPPDLLAAVERAIAADPEAAKDPVDRRSLAGVRVLVTAGGTREPIDAVRYVGNRSSGRMGWAVAAEAAKRGAEVTVVAAGVTLPRDPAIAYVDVGTAAELAAASLAAFETADLLVMAAAVADYRPARTHAGKIKKDAAGETMTLELERTEDVLAALSARRRPRQVLIGFAAEHGDGALRHGRDKLARKNLDAVVVNDVSQPGIGFDSHDNEVTIVTRAGEVHVPRADKRRVAAAILDAAEELRHAAAAGGDGRRSPAVA